MSEGQGTISHSEVFELWDKGGKKQVDIARELKCSRQFVSYVLASRSAEVKNPRAISIDWDEVDRLREEENLSGRQIASRLGIHPNTFWFRNRRRERGSARNET